MSFSPETQVEEFTFNNFIKKEIAYRAKPDPNLERVSPLPFDYKIKEGSNSYQTVKCPIISAKENKQNSFFHLNYYIQFESKYPQSYWDSHGLLAYFTN